MEFQQNAMETVGAAGFRLIQFGADVVMIEDKLLAEQVEEHTDQKEKIGWITSVNDIETAYQQNSPGQKKGPKQRRGVFDRVAERALAFDRQIVAPDSDTVDHFEFLLATLSSGENDRPNLTCA